MKRKDNDKRYISACCGKEIALYSGNQWGCTGCFQDVPAPKKLPRKVVAATIAVAGSTSAQAHPGHGETLHSHPELWVVIVLVAAATMFFRRNVA